MTTNNPRIWRQAVACVVTFLVVVFSPGLSCYTAFAQDIGAEGSHDAIPAEASVDMPGVGISGLNSEALDVSNVNLGVEGFSANTPVANLGSRTASARMPSSIVAPQAAPASAHELNSAPDSRSAEALPTSAAAPRASLDDEPLSPGAAGPSENTAAIQAEGKNPVRPVLATAIKIQKEATRLSETGSPEALDKFLRFVYNGLVPGKAERGVSAPVPASSAKNTAELKAPPAQGALQQEKSGPAVPGPTFQIRDWIKSPTQAWKQRPSMGQIARHTLEMLKDPRMLVYFGALAATIIAWLRAAPAVDVGVLAAGTGVARGVFLAHRPKIKDFIGRSKIRQAVLGVAAAGFFLAGRFLLGSDLSLLLYAMAGSSTAVALAPLAAKVGAGIKSIKDSVVWISKFWSRIGGTGIKVSRQLIAASVLGVGTSALSLVPPKYYGYMFQRLKDLLPSASAAHPGILHLYLTWGGIMLASYAAMAVLNYFLSRFMYDIGNRMMAGLSNLFYEHVAKLPLSWHKSHPVGDVISTGTDAIYQMQSAATMVVVDTVKDITLLVPSLAVMFYSSWQMSLILLPAILLALALPSSIYSNRSSRAYKWFFRDLKPLIASHIEQTEVNSETIKSAGKEEWETKRTRDFSHKTYIDGGEALARVNAPYRALSGGVTSLVQVGLVIASALAVHLGIFSIPTATFYYFAANYSRTAVQDLCDTYVQLKSMRGSAAKFDRIMGDTEENYNKDGIALAPSSSGRAIGFDHVSFGYRPSEPVLKEITFNAKPGEMIALVGESGSGKTTITRLLLGLLKPTEGSVRIDGQDLSEINIKDFRSHVGTILQDPVPFDESMAYNIKYFKPEATEEQVQAAAEAAGLHGDLVRLGYGHNLEVVGSQDLGREILDSGKNSLANKIFKRLLRALIGKDADLTLPSEDRRAETDKQLVSFISGRVLEARRILLGPSAPADIAPAKSILDNIAWGSGASFEDVVAAAKKAGINDDIVRLGYNSRVGERGANLSGGQKQKLLLARLFLSAGHPWDIMILDEPTAALDGVTQQRIQDVLDAAHGKTTIVMVAHRLSTVQAADKIVVFNRGAIVEQGTHEELMRRQGVYAKLWQAQKLLNEAQDQGAPAAK